jgi:hypothetical protein
MAIFKKKEPTIGSTPPLPALDEPWFGAYFDGILKDAAVPPDDGQNRMQVIMFVLWRTVDITIEAVFQNDPSAAYEYQTLIESRTPATPAQRAAFLVSRDPSAAWVLVNQLSKHRAILVQAGQMYGKMRFFPNRCCDEPTEFDLQDGSAHCSKCHNPVQFKETM